MLGVAGKSNGICDDAALSPEGWLWTCRLSQGFVRLVDDDDTELVQRLLTKVGCIMEDCSVVALSWGAASSLRDRLDKVQHATHAISALVEAARVVAKL